MCTNATLCVTRTGQPSQPRSNAQVEISQLKAERERIRGGAAASEARIEDLLREVESSKQVGQDTWSEHHSGLCLLYEVLHQEQDS